MWRAIDFFEDDKIDARALKNLLRAAIEFNQSRSKKKVAAKVGRKVSAGSRAKVSKSRKA